VEDEFPNAVNAGQRFGRGGGGVYIVQQFEQSRPMPGAAVKGAAELVGDAEGLVVVRGSYHFPNPRVSMNTGVSCMMSE
jgi:hypothetical protein